MKKRVEDREKRIIKENRKINTGRRKKQRD